MIVILLYEFTYLCDLLAMQGRKTRNAELTRLADHIRNIYVKRDRTWIILFPEGGFLCNRKESSQVYVVDSLVVCVMSWFFCNNLSNNDLFMQNFAKSLSIVSGVRRDLLLLEPSQEIEIVAQYLVETFYG